MGRKQVQHVIQEGYAGGKVNLAGAVQVQFHFDVSFPGFPGYAAAAAHGRVSLG